MQTATIETIIRIVAADPEATPQQRDAVVQACRCRQTKRRLGTKRDAAEILDVHPESIKRYSRRGLLHPIRITARRVRYDLDECEKLMQYGAEATRPERS